MNRRSFFGALLAAPLAFRMKREKLYAYAPGGPLLPLPEPPRMVGERNMPELLRAVEQMRFHPQAFTLTCELQRTYNRQLSELAESITFERG